MLKVVDKRTLVCWCQNIFDERTIVIHGPYADEATVEVGDIILYHMADIDDEEGDGYLVQVYPMAQELDGLLRLPELEVEFVREMITVSKRA